MNASSYVPAHTGLLLVDPCNDFLSEGGKLHGRAKPVADSVGTLANLKAVVAAARKAGMQIFYVPHHRAEPDELARWNPPQPLPTRRQRCASVCGSTWGGECPLDCHDDGVYRGVRLIAVR
ncbi:hypothetical protein ACIQU2_13260 [Pseudomonas sp. NPDC098740]|uniref:hypothetical protein n=1 Tax=Pseudomonas sp. NPDC098740 TaxID=3364486 RepID=UPI00383A7E6E